MQRQHTVTIMQAVADYACRHEEQQQSWAGTLPQDRLVADQQHQTDPDDTTSHMLLETGHTSYAAALQSFSIEAGVTLDQSQSLNLISSSADICFRCQLLQS